MANYRTVDELPNNVFLEQNIRDKDELNTFIEYAKSSYVSLMHYKEDDDNFYFLSSHEEVPNCEVIPLKKVSKSEIYNAILASVLDGTYSANTDEYQHYLCELIIRYLYGENADVGKYKVYHGNGKRKAFDNLRGVDITKFDYTTEAHVAKYEVVYDNKVAEALKQAGFRKKYGDLHMHDDGESLFKATIESRVYPQCNLKKSILSIYAK